MQPLPNTAKLAELALRNYYDTMSGKTSSTYEDPDSPPFYKDISPKRSNRFKVGEVDEEA